MLFFKNKCLARVAVKPSEMNRDIDTTLKNHIKDMVEGKCIKEGYVKPGSVKLIKKSPGVAMQDQFNGNILYNVEYTCDICDPKEGQEFECQVTNINKMGILASGGDGALNVLLARAHHIDNEEFTEINEYDRINVSVIGIRKEYGDNQISVIAKLEKRVSKSSPVPEDEETMLEEIEEAAAAPEIKFTNKTATYKGITPVNLTSEFSYRGALFKTITHAYASEKSGDSKYRDLFRVDHPSYVGDAITNVKKASTKTNMKKIKVKMLDGWEDKQRAILKDITKEYFTQNGALLKKLKDTGNGKLVYNQTGIVPAEDYSDILMELRSEL